VFDGQNGLFVGNPSEYSKKDDKYYDRVFIPRELKDELEKDAIEEYGGDRMEDSGMPF
jgi:DNA-binding cell septation regulator SpoVG